MWDYQTHSAGRVHPIFLIRRGLNEREIRPIEMCYRIGRMVRPVWGTPPPSITVAGLMILRQKPPTAKGVFFLTLQDETGVIQCVVRPEVLEALDAVLRSSVLIVAGELGIAGNWRGWSSETRGDWMGCSAGTRGIRTMPAEGIGGCERRRA